MIVYEVWSSIYDIPVFALLLLCMIPIVIEALFSSGLFNIRMRGLVSWEVARGRCYPFVQQNHIQSFSSFTHHQSS